MFSQSDLSRYEGDQSILIKKLDKLSLTKLKLSDYVIDVPTFYIFICRQVKILIKHSSDQQSSNRQFGHDKSFWVFYYRWFSIILVDNCSILMIIFKSCSFWGGTDPALKYLPLGKVNCTFIVTENPWFARSRNEFLYENTFMKSSS